MLEVRNLTKIYASKAGAPVRALDGVTLRFPETGMVFLLGRSGSGKSTLLNVTGGLDQPTDGEIIVKGKSSKSFSQSDFDSYRNTFVGFVFQEYNILNEFSVENNIALALELQGKPKDKKAIAEILEQVDLAGYAKRKPNTLSGGQKQRIAIARALIKNPEIIMADEPTGALDSNTGRQVFDTLKKLSETKLVIVVSHDREFAEQYGDRVIELADGKVISDISKSEEAQTEINSNVSVVGGTTLCVKDGEALTEDDFTFIKDFLKKTKNAIVASEEKDVTAFKKAARINESGAKEVFSDTDENKIPKKEYSPKDAKFIRSKLPARHAFKLGASGMKLKPIRLMLTTVLCTVAFILFGLLSTMMLYKSDAVFMESMKTSGYSMIALEKGYVVTVTASYGNKTDEYTSHRSTNFTADEIEDMAALFGDKTFGAISTKMNVGNLDSNPTTSTPYYLTSLNYLATLSESNSLRSSIMGEYPDGDDEILISDYLAAGLVNYMLYDPDTDQNYTLNQPSDVVGKKINLGGEIYTVSGIVETPEIPENYDIFKDSTSQNYSDYYDFQNELSANLYLIGFLSEDAFAEKAAAEGDDGWVEFETIFGNNYVQMTMPNANDSEFAREIYYAPISSATPSVKTFYFDSEKTSLSEGEIIINSMLCNDLVNEAYNAWQSSADYDEALAEEFMSGVNGGDSIQTVAQLAFYGSETVYDEETGQYISSPIPDSERQAYLNEVADWFERANMAPYLTAEICALDMNWTRVESTEASLSIVGIAQLSSEIWNQYAFVNDSLYSSMKEKVDQVNDQMGFYTETITTKYTVPEGAIYSTVYADYDHSDAATQLLADYRSTVNEDDSYVSINNTTVDQLQMVDSLVESFSQAFLYAGIVMAVFAALLLSNFITVSISAKTREIGILRAVGARSLDVFKIFFSETFIITAICIVLSVIGGTVVCNMLNGMISNTSGIALFVFGPVSIAILVAVAVATAILATVLPVWRAARRKPVESIRAL